ncbi:PREDICTED: regulator of telomere elongation helicase 1-like [Camelina sativa]|uniref:Regulator of telomere elongation helicase 1-like n=1 Tax=Camelina sativa TaxID=90675 RepID=A0ABM0WLZ6_CAMSA|nr:PREDICTED: regulator of telomere elongation helicase 1-like [Camelina sativa]
MPIYSIRGIDVDFPFEAYQSQIIYMDRVIESLQNKCHALLESPTGTGKTLCLLCATLAWRRSLGCFSTRKDRKNTEIPWKDSDDLMSQSGGGGGGGGGFPTIVYASRTHSQLRQVIKELKRSSYRPKMVVLGSREQLCVNEEVNSLRGKALTNACQYLCKKRGKRQCNHFNRIPDYLKHNPHIGDEPVDIEDLVNIGKDSGPCPYYITREVHKDVDIIFAPYNYLISNGYRKYLKVNWNDSVLIFDEAHNLESLCADSASFDLPSVLLSACISEAQECVELAAARRNSLNDVSVNPETFAILKGLLLKLQELISKVPIPKKDEGFTKPGPYIYEMLKSLNITHETAPKLIGTVEEAAVFLEEEKQQTATNSGSKLEIIADMLKLIFRENGSNHADVYRVHVQELEQSPTDVIKGKVSRTLSWWCFSPGITMLDIAKKGVGSIILTSGTLSPMDSLAQELKLDFPVRLENPHVISSNQLWAGVVSTGPSGYVLNSSYRNRDVPEYKQELGNAIVNFSRVVPEALLIFFPSYYLMDSCISFWKNGCQRNSMTIWERICKLKKPVIEPKDSSLFPAAMQDFSEKLQDKSTWGVVFFAVCRGKVSEGLDFADGAGRAVVITGLPYARVTDPRVKLKREFLDDQSQRADVKVSRSTLLSGSMWYSQEAARAVNQAIGRVIRHRHDYGAIIFCDDRFEQPSQQSKISLWIRPNVKCYSRYGEVISDLARFFRIERSNFPTGLGTELENNIVSTLLPMETSKGNPTPASGNSNLKNVGISKNELSKLDAFPPANRASPLERDGNNIKWKGLTILKHTGKIPRIVKADVMQGCSSRKTKFVELSDDEETPVERRCEIVDLECDNCEKQTRETEVLSSSSCFNTMGLIKKRKVPESQGSASSSVLTAKRNGGGDKKEASASAFLSQVKEKLNTEEYKKFIGYMQALKKKEIKLANVMQSIVQLFCGRERDHLLMGFKDFVPVKYRPAYEECIKTRKREG